MDGMQVWRPGLIQMEAPPPPPDPEELARAERAQLEAEARERGYAEGFARGLADGKAEGNVDGFQSGKREVDMLCAQIGGILDSFTRPLARLDVEVTEQLAELATHIAGTLLREHYSANPLAMAELIGTAVRAVGEIEREVELRLNPADAGTLVPFLTANPGVRMVEDETLARGDLRVHAESLRIDGSLQTRLKECLHAMTQELR